MTRSIGVVLLVSCLSARLFAQVPTEPVPAGQNPGGQSGTDAATQVTLAANADYPLDAFKNFSAIMVGSIMEMGDGTVESFIYRSGNLMRMEGIEEHGYLITDLTTLDTYGVSTGPCMHDTHPFFRASPFAAVRPGYKVQRVPVGTETVDGHSCKVEDVTVSSPDAGKPLKMRFWEADDLQGFPIKIDFERADNRHSTVRYKNVFLGPQDPTLFIHPKSCGSLPTSSTAKKHRSSTHKKKPAATAPSSSSNN